MSEFFLAVVNMSIAASWIVLAVLLLRLLLKKAPKWIIVLLWGIVAVRLICPFSIESVMSLIPSAQTINPEILVEQAPAIDSDFPMLDGIENPVINGTDSPVIGEPVTPVPDTAPTTPVQTVIPVLSAVWLVGIAGMLTYTVISYFRVKEKIGTAVRLRDNIFQSERVVSPFILGLVKPKIYLPFCMNGQDMEYVMAHENAHIRRKDHWWKPIGFLILTIHWFNPLLWLGYVLLCRDIELACDEKVIKKLDLQQKADYSQALLNCSVNRRILAACPLAFGEVGIKERVKSVLNYKKPAFWIIVVAIVASIVTAVCFLTDPVDRKPDDTTQQTDPSDATESTESSDVTDSITEKFLKGEISATNKDGRKVSIQDYLRGDYNKYALYDMSGDAIPELILKTGEGLVILAENEQGLTVWYQGTIYENPLDNRAIFYERPGGAPEHTTYQYIVLDHNGEELQRTTFSEYYGDNAEYLINGEKASKTAYEDLYKSFDLSDDAIVWKDIPATDETKTTTDVYKAFLDGYVTDTSVLYFTKDIDNNGTEELFIHQNTAIEVYTYEGAVKKVGTHDFITGTLLLHHTNDKKYPGIVYVTVGGGKEHFGYITITDGALSVKQTFDDDYGMISGEKEDVFYTDDEYLIAISRKVYEDLFYRIGYSFWSPKTTEDPYAIREITDERFVTVGDKKVFNNTQITLSVPASWKCLTASGEDNVVYYFRDPVWGEKCQLSVGVTFKEYYKERTREQYLESLSYSYENVVIDSFATDNIHGFPCTKMVFSYTKDNTKFIDTWYHNLIEGSRLYDFRITCPAAESEAYEKAFAAIMNSVRFLLTDKVDISSLPLDEAYAYADKQYKEDPLNHRLICDLQPETQQIIKIDGKYYQSYVASNVDIRYVWISRLEFPDNNTALWDWYAVGSSQVYSLDLLGKIDEGRVEEPDKIDVADMDLLSALYNKSPFITQKGTTVYLNAYKPYYKHSEDTDYYEKENVFVPQDYTFVDLDKDGKKELIVAEAPYADTFLILREENGKIYGYSLPNRWFQALKQDGSFQSSGGALIHDYNTISFSQNTYQMSTIAKFHFEADDKKPVSDKYGYAPDYEKSVFEINGKPVSFEEIRQFAEEWDTRPGAVWMKLT